MIAGLIEFLGESNPLSQLILSCRAKRADPGFSFSGAFGQVDEELGDLSYTGSSFDMEFESDVPNESDLYWHAEFCIGEIQEPDDPLIIYVTDRHGNPIAAGTFVFLGLPIALHEGIAESTLRHFRDNLTDNNLSLQRPGASPVPGGLAY